MFTYIFTHMFTHMILTYVHTCYPPPSPPPHRRVTLRSQTPGLIWLRRNKKLCYISLSVCLSCQSISWNCGLSLCLMSFQSHFILVCPGLFRHQKKRYRSVRMSTLSAGQYAVFVCTWKIPLVSLYACSVQCFPGVFCSQNICSTVLKSPSKSHKDCKYMTGPNIIYLFKINKKDICRIQYLTATQGIIK